MYVVRWEEENWSAYQGEYVQKSSTLRKPSMAISRSTAKTLVFYILSLATRHFSSANGQFYFAFIDGVPTQLQEK